MRIEMKVSSLLSDPFTETPIIILRDESGTHSVPIWIGNLEAAAIAAQLEKVPLDRPMTHDLMKTLLEITAARVDSIEIHDLRQGTFFATIHLVPNGGAAAAVDARPSDAIALALRTGAPIYVTKKVIDKVRRKAQAQQGQGKSTKSTKEGAVVVYESPENPDGVTSEPAPKWKM